MINAYTTITKKGGKGKGKRVKGWILQGMYLSHKMRSLIGVGHNPPSIYLPFPLSPFPFFVKSNGFISL